MILNICFLIFLRVAYLNLQRPNPLLCWSPVFEDESPL